MNKVTPYFYNIRRCLESIEKVGTKFVLFLKNIRSETMQKENFLTNLNLNPVLCTVKRW